MAYGKKGYRHGGHKKYHKSSKRRHGKRSTKRLNTYRASRGGTRL